MAKYFFNIIFVKYKHHTMPLQLKNIKGGGLHYVSDFKSTQTQIFRGGLRHYTRHQERLILGSKNKPTDYHDKIDYERGCIVHSRSPTTQYLNFHYMFGGFKKYFVDRWFVNHFYKKWIRLTWAPALIYYVACCYSMRQYDNAAYDFFYFSD